STCETYCLDVQRVEVRHQYDLSINKDSQPCAEVVRRQFSHLLLALGGECDNDHWLAACIFLYSGAVDISVGEFDSTVQIDLVSSPSDVGFNKALSSSGLRTTKFDRDGRCCIAASD